MSTAALPLSISKSSRRRTAPSAATMVGVDIGCHSAKIVQLEKGFATVRPRVCRVVPHEVPLTPDDPLRCLDEIERTLRRAWSSRNCWCPLPAACILSMNLMTFRTFELPLAEGSPVTSQDWQNSFVSETEAMSSGMIVEGWPTQTALPARGNSSFAALGIDESFASAIVDRFWKCGLDCQVLDGLPFAMARAVTGAGIEGTVAVIDWGYSTMTLTVVVDNRPYFTRVFRDCELRSLTSVVMRSLQLEAPQCQQLMTAYGFGQSTRDFEATEMSAMLAEIAAPYLNRLSDELRRTWQFLQQLTGQTPARVILMGGGATLKSSASIVSSAIRVPIEVWSLPHNSNSGGGPESASAPFGPAFALARLTRNK